MNSIVWFRKGLRLHDNPALLAALEGAKHVYPVFILDPYFLKPDPSAPSPGSTRVGINRIQFLLQSLQVQPRPCVLHTALTCITTRQRGGDSMTATLNHALRHSRYVPRYGLYAPCDVLTTLL